MRILLSGNKQFKMICEIFAIGVHLAPLEEYADQVLHAADSWAEQDFKYNSKPQNVWLHIK